MCGEEDWSVEAVTKANAFFRSTERDYVILHVGEKTCVIKRTLAEQLRRMVDDADG